MNQVFHIRSGEAVEPQQSNFLLEVGKRHCCFGLVNHHSGEWQAFGYYTAGSENEDLITGVFEKHPELGLPFSNSLISYDLPECVLIPSAYYKNEEAALHLQAVYGVNGQCNIIYGHLPHLNLYNACRVPTAIHDSLSSKIVSGKYLHKYSVYLDKISSAITDTLILDFKTDEITVFAFRTGGLQLAQTFLYTSPEDVLYYLLKTCQQFSLSQQEVKVELSGLIEKDSALYRELYKYFLHLDFAMLPPGIKLSPVFIGYPEHYFSTLSKLALCAS